MKKIIMGDKKRMNKKAQITLFIIIGIIVLTIIIILLFLKNNLNLEEKKEKQIFLDEKCINNIFVEEMKKAGFRGGSKKNTVSKTINFNNKNIIVNYGLWFYKPKKVYNWNFYGSKYGLSSLPNINVVKKEVEDNLKNRISDECDYNIKSLEVLFNDEKTFLFLKVKKKESKENFKNIKLTYDLPFKKMYYLLIREMDLEANEENHNFSNFYNKEFESEYYPNINGEDDLFILKTKDNIFNGEQYYFYSLIKDRLPYVKENLNCKISFSKIDDSNFKILNLKLKDNDEKKIVDEDEKDFLNENYGYELQSCTFFCESDNQEKEIKVNDEISFCTNKFLDVLSTNKNFFIGKVKKIKLYSDGTEYEGDIKI